MSRQPTIIDAIKNPKLFGVIAAIQKARDLDSLARGAESHLRSGNDRR